MMIICLWLHWQKVKFEIKIIFLNYENITPDELSDANVQSHQKLTQKNVPDDIIKCPEKDCKFNVSLCEKTGLICILNNIKNLSKSFI